jgi:glycosyltransferase involved in cell wall biosynthesis
VKIVLAHPSYGPLDSEVNKALRVAMMSAAQVAEWVGDVSTIREGWVGARNRAVKAALEDAPDCDGVIWVDDDVLLPPTAIKRLVSYGQDFVTGIVFQKFGDLNPLVAKWVGNGFSWWREFPENVLAPADGCGFGCCFTSTKMLRAIAELPTDRVSGKAYFKKDGWFNQFPANHFGKQIDADSEQAMSEDFSFCMRAKMSGFQLFADTGLLCSHMIGPKFSTKRTYDKYWAEKKEQQEKTLAVLDGVA